MSLNITYSPEPTPLRFHNDTSSEVKGILGPVGSGKSVACCIELLRAAMMQEPHTDGVRYSRAVVVRNTYDQLKNTTLKTWLQWVPIELGTFLKTSPMVHHLKFPLADGTRVDCEVIFMSMEDEADKAKLKSLEVTFIWFNELSELERHGKELFDLATTRLKRYPNDPMHGTYTRSYLIFDSNPPPADERHWVYRLLEIDKPKGYTFYFQPPAIYYDDERKEWVGHPDAENVKGHKEGYDYWLKMIPGKDEQFIRVMFEGKYGLLKGGRPVYDRVYDDKYHMSEKEYEADRNLPVLLGLDWGLHPAIIFAQLSRGGTLRLLKELAPDVDMSLEELLDDEFPVFIQQHFRGCRFEGWGDPSGLNRSGLDKRTPYQLCARAGLRIQPAISNDPIVRRDAVIHFLRKKDGLQINPSMTKIRIGFQTKYAYEKLKGSDGYKDKAEKNMYSHPHDALQYLCLGIRNPNAYRAPVVRKTGVAA